MNTHLNGNKACTGMLNNYSLLDKKFSTLSSSLKKSLLGAPRAQPTSYTHKIITWSSIIIILYVTLLKIRSLVSSLYMHISVVHHNPTRLDNPCMGNQRSKPVCSWALCHKTKIFNIITQQNWMTHTHTHSYQEHTNKLPTPQPWIRTPIWWWKWNTITKKKLSCIHCISQDMQ